MSTQHSSAQASEDCSAVSSADSLTHILVVVEDDVLNADRPIETTLLSRARMLVACTGCTLELFHVCSEKSLDQSFFWEQDSVTRHQLDVLDRTATRLSELALELHDSAHTRVDHEARWDRPDADAIIRRAFETNASMVMKTMGNADYVVGLSTNTDWDLIRQSPANLWLVNENTPEIEHMITAVGYSTETAFDAHDYDVGTLSMQLSRQLNIDNSLLHTYFAPATLAARSATPTLFPVVPAEHKEALARQHRKAIEGWAAYFHLDPAQIRVSEGRPAERLPEMANAIDAGLIVLGARNMNRLERFFKPVTAEPVHARTDCDLVFVREQVPEERIPAAANPPVFGLPKVDLEQAVLDPARTFHTPENLAGQDALASATRVRLLKIWEQDVRQVMNEEDEGGPVQNSQADLLGAIRRVRRNLEARDRAVTPPAQPEFN